MHRVVFVAALLLLCISLAGCGMFGPPAPATPTAAAWAPHENAEVGFAVDLPSTWHAWNLNARTGLVQMQTDANHDELIKAYVNGQKWDEIIKAGVVLAACDLGDKASVPPFLTELKVYRSPNGTGMDLTTVAQKYEAGFDGDPALYTRITRKPVTLQAGEAIEFRFQYTLGLMTGKGDEWGSQLIDKIDYMYVDKTGVYLIMMATTPEQAQAYAPVFEQIGKSFRLLPK